VSTIQDSLARQLFIMHREQRITVYESPAASLSSRIGVLNCPLFLFNSCLSAVDCREI